MPDLSSSASGEPQTAAQRFVTFRVADHHYALAAEEVAEIIRMPAIARVPQSPKALLGLAHFRGSVLPVASVRRLLGREEQDAKDHARAIILDGGSPVALAVDAVESLVGVEPDDIEERQAELGALPGESLKGAFLSGAARRLTKILDIQALLHAAFAQRARSVREMRPVTLTSAVQQDVEVAADEQKLITFDIAGQEYAFAMDVVREIIAAPESVAGVAGAERFTLGMIGFRNTLLPLLSLRGLLGFPPVAEDSVRQKVIVIDIGGGLVGLVVDSMRAIISADARLLEPIPPILAARTGGESRIRSIYRAEGGRRLVSVLAPEILFREDVMQRLRAARATTGSTGAEDQDTQEQKVQFLIFHLGDNEFGLPIEAIDEVSLVPEQITKLPKAPKFLEGVVNLRGEVLPVVDQRRRFDMPILAQGDRRRLIVVRTERHRAGLIVDGVSEVLRTSAESVKPAPELTEDTTRLVRGVLNVEQGGGRLVVILDSNELLTRAEQALLDAFKAEPK